MRTLPVTLLGRFIAYNAVTTGDEALTRVWTLRGALTRAFRRCFVAASYLVVSLDSGAGDHHQRAVLAAARSDNANLMLAKSERSKAAIVESPLFYVYRRCKTLPAR
jgi:hypothetical protein